MTRMAGVVGVLPVHAQPDRAEEYDEASEDDERSLPRRLSPAHGETHHQPRAQHETQHDEKFEYGHIVNLTALESGIEFLVSVASPHRRQPGGVAAHDGAGHHDNADAFLDERASDLHGSLGRHVLAGDCLPRTTGAITGEEIIVDATVLDNETLRRQALVGGFDTHRVPVLHQPDMTTAVALLPHVDRVEFAVTFQTQDHVLLLRFYSRDAQVYH